MITTQLDFLKNLIKCKSVTPKDDGAIDLLISELEPLGFKCNKLIFSDDNEAVTNLYAKYGNGKKNLCFSGHTDVVPTGDLNKWNSDPFELIIKDSKLYGRGIVDMKGAITSSIFAMREYIESNKNTDNFKLSVLISGNEEDKATNGMIKLIKWLRANNHKIDACILGEPTNSDDKLLRIKNGSRGSINFKLTVNGIQGHVAYQKNAKNPIDILVKLLDDIKSHILDKGSEYFQPSNLEITTLTTDNKATNVIPAKAMAGFNIRFNDQHTSNSLIKWINNIAKKYSSDYSLDATKEGEAFYVEDSSLLVVVSQSIKEIYKTKPVINTFGASSDARFLKDLCPVIEFGLSNKTAHKVNEFTTIKELEDLKNIYLNSIKNYFV